MNDVSMGTIEQALRALSARQRAVADNIANLQTPGFVARKVSFEDSLRQAAADPDGPRPATLTTVRSLAPTRSDGNNVNLDEETLTLVDTNLRYQTMVEAMNTKFRLLRTAIRGGA